MRSCGPSPVSFYKILFHFKASLWESIILLSPPTCKAYTIAILLHSYCAMYAPPPTPPFYAVNHTIWVMAISCKGQFPSRSGWKKNSSVWTIQGWIVEAESTQLYLHWNSSPSSNIRVWIVQSYQTQLYLSGDWPCLIPSGRCRPPRLALGAAHPRRTLECGSLNRTKPSCIWVAIDRVSPPPEDADPRFWSPPPTWNFGRFCLSNGFFFKHFVLCASFTLMWYNRNNYSRIWYSFLQAYVCTLLSCVYLNEASSSRRADQPPRYICIYIHLYIYNIIYIHIYI